MVPRPKDQVRLSFAERFKLLFAVTVALTKTCGSALAAPFVPRDKRSRAFRRHVGYSYIRNTFLQTNSRIEQALSADTDRNYEKWAKKHKVPPGIESLDDGTGAFWFGSKKAQTVLVYFHGGGYNLPAIPQYMDFLGNLVSDLNKPTTTESPDAPDSAFAALLLHYDVAPYQTYPRQLAQAATLLNHALRTLDIPPQNIILGGDSAGANLVLGVLSHLLHPHPDPSVPKLDLRGSGDDAWQGEGRFRGALLISPWADPFATHYASLARNAGKDCLASAYLQRWATLFVGDKPYDAYNRPIAAPEGWWDGVEGVVDRFIVAAGADEVLFDGQVEFAEKFRKAWRREAEGEGIARVVVAEDEGHDSCILDPGFGFKRDQVKMYVQVRDWLREIV